MFDTLIVCVTWGTCMKALASFQVHRDAHDSAKREAIEQHRAANACAAMGRPIGSQWCLSPSNNSATDLGEVCTILGLSGVDEAGNGELKVEFSKAGTMVVQKEALITIEAWHEYEMVLHSRRSILFCISYIVAMHFLNSFCK